MAAAAAEGGAPMNSMGCAPLDPLDALRSTAMDCSRCPLADADARAWLMRRRRTARTHRTRKERSAMCVHRVWREG